MSHANAPLTPAGRLRLIERCRTRPIAHVAAEAGLSRQCLSKWKQRFDQLGQAGLSDRSSAPHANPDQTPTEVVARIEQLRREHKLSARRITVELAGKGITISTATVGRWLVRLGINHRRDLDPSGASNRRATPITARYPGHMIHLDIKKVGVIPDGGGWRAHGRGSDGARASKRASTPRPARGYTYLHSAVDGFSRVTYTEPLPDEKATTAIAFFTRARLFFAAHGINRITRVVTDNGSCYRAATFTASLHAAGVARHQRIRPFTPRHNGKVERYNRILAEEFLYARTWTSETQRAEAVKVWNIHYNYHRPHTAAGDRPPASRLHTAVTNLMPANS